MFKGFKALLLNSAIAASLFGSNPASADIYVEEGFESGSIASYKASIEGSGSFQIVSGGARAGTKFLRITKNKGSKRYELRLEEHLKPSDRWYGFSMRLQSDMQNTNEKTGLSNYWDSRRITPTSAPAGQGKRSDIPLQTMNRGQWYDFVVHYKYSSNGDGLIEIYGAPAGSQVQLLQKLTGSNSFNDARGQFRLGLYGAEDDFTAYIDYDAVRVGTSLNEVKPR